MLLCLFQKIGLPLLLKSNCAGLVVQGSDPFHLGLPLLFFFQLAGGLLDSLLLLGLGLLLGILDGVLLLFQFL